MADTNEDTPRLAEIARTVKDFRDEMRSSLSQLVRRDVYEAEQRHVLDRVSTLERDRDAAEKAREAEQQRALDAMKSMRRQLVVGVVLALVAAALAATPAILRAIVH